MSHTQVEITRIGTNDQAVVWMPVPEKTVRVGDKVLVKQEYENYHDWVVTQVCVTSNYVPRVGRIASDFQLKNNYRPLIHMYLY